MFKVLQTEFTVESVPKLEIIRVFGGTIKKYGYLDQSIHGIFITVDDITRTNAICPMKYS